MSYASDVIKVAFQEQLDERISQVREMCNTARAMEDDYDINMAMTHRQLQHALEKLDTARDRFNRDVLGMSTSDRQYEKDLT